MTFVEQGDIKDARRHGASLQNTYYGLSGLSLRPIPSSTTSPQQTLCREIGSVPCGGLAAGNDFVSVLYNYGFLPTILLEDR